MKKTENSLHPNVYNIKKQNMKKDEKIEIMFYGLKIIVSQPSFYSIIIVLLVLLYLLIK